MGSKDIECRCSQKYGQCRLGMTASSYSRKPHFVFENRERSFAAVTAQGINFLLRESKRFLGMSC